jgi:hypothetical protein
MRRKLTAVVLIVTALITAWIVERKTRPDLVDEYGE